MDDGIALIWVDTLSAVAVSMRVRNGHTTNIRIVTGRAMEAVRLAFLTLLRLATTTGADEVNAAVMPPARLWNIVCQCICKILGQDSMNRAPLSSMEPSPCTYPSISTKP